MGMGEMSMKFLIQIPQLIYGGAEKVLVSFANCLVEHGHEVEILETYEKGFLKPQFDSRVTFHSICSKEYTEKYYASMAQIKEELHPGKKLALCGKKLFSAVVGYREYAEKLTAKYYRNQQCDVAINYLEIDSPQFLLEHIKADKYMQWYHIDVANLDDPENTDRMIPWYEKMNAIFCVANTARDSFVQRYPQLADKTYVMYNFFETEMIQRMAEESFSFNTDKTVILSVGRMTPQKKYLRFLNVLARLRKEGFEFEWHVLGTGVQKEEIERKISELHLESCVILEGVTDNPYKYMKNCDLFVLPSGWEGFPTVTIEAKVLGCPVLATDVSGIREQMIHGETGWIVENSEEAIYIGLKKLLGEPELRKKLRNNFGIQKIADNEEKYMEFMRYTGERD